MDFSHSISLLIPHRIRTVIPTKIEVAVYEELAFLRSLLSREEVRIPSGQVRLSDHLP